MTVRAVCRTVGLPERTYYDRRARHRAGQQARGPWPTPARDRVRERVIEMALTFPMWGHRKIAWLCRHDGLKVSDATCLRVLRAAGLVLPVDYSSSPARLPRPRPTAKRPPRSRTPAARPTTSSATVSSMT